MNELIFNDLLLKRAIDPAKVIIMRHRPFERELAKVLLWLAADKPDLFVAYQQTQGEKLEGTLRTMEGAGHVASFIGHESGKALFVGVYEIVVSRSLSREDYWKLPAFTELKSLGMNGFTDDQDRESILWFDLNLPDAFADWKGKLVSAGRRRKDHGGIDPTRNEMPVLAVREESAIDAAMTEWEAIDLGWHELAILPSQCREAHSHWRGIYLIFDESDGKSYVGSAYGAGTLLSRWTEYAASGHGGN